MTISKSSAVCIEMENLLTVVKLVFPVYLIVFMGFLFYRKGIYTKSVDRFLNNVTFNYILPAMILKGLIYSDIVISRDILIMLFFMALAFGSFYLIYRYLNIPLNFMILSLRGNIAYLGIPVMSMILPPTQYYKGILFLSFLSPLSIVMASFFDQGNDAGKNLIIRLLKNPFLWTLFIGLLIKKSNIELPYLEPFFIKVTDSLFFITLIIVGANMRFKEFSSLSWTEVWAILNKLVLLPLLFLIYAKLMNLNTGCIAIGLIIFSTPTGVTNFTVIKKLGMPEKGVVKNIMLTTFLYFQYLPFLVMLLRK